MGFTLVLVTHDDDLALRMNRQIHLGDGRVVDRDGNDAEKPRPRSRRQILTSTPDRAISAATTSHQKTGPTT